MFSQVWKHATIKLLLVWPTHILTWAHRLTAIQSDINSIRITHFIFQIHNTEAPVTCTSIIRADSRFAPSQWVTVLLCNNVSHWPGASLKLYHMRVWYRISVVAHFLAPHTARSSSTCHKSRQSKFHHGNTSCLLQVPENAGIPLQVS